MAEKKAFSITDFYLILAMVLWGSDFYFAKIALREMTPISFAAIRTAISAAILVPFFLRREKNWAVDRRHFFWLAGLAFVGTFANRYFGSLGVRFTTASNSALLMATSPIFALLVSFLFFRTEVSSRATAGIFIAFAGVFLVIQQDWQGWAATSESFRGDLFMMAAAFSWSLFTVLARRVLREYSSLKVTAYVLTIGTVFFLPFMTSEEIGGWANVSGVAWLCVIYVGVMGNALAYFLYVRGIQNIGALRTVLYNYLMPLTAIFFAAPLLNETLTAAQILGVAIIFGGIFLARSG